eukprot:8952021-Heterocapsa_arctica.AAC.1
MNVGGPFSSACKYALTQSDCRSVKSFDAALTARIARHGVIVLGTVPSSVSICAPYLCTVTKMRLQSR